MTLTSRDHGTIEGKMGLHGLDDGESTLAFLITIPVSLEGVEANLTVELRYPGVSSPMELSGRSYHFGAKHPLHGMSDGQTYVRDQVFADIRSAADHFDSFIDEINFHEAREAELGVEIKGRYVRGGSSRPFELSSTLSVSRA